MSEAVVGSLVYQFKADTSGLKAGFTEAQTQLRGMSTNAADAGKKAAEAAQQAGNAFKQMADRVAEAAYELGPWTGQHVEITKAAIVGLQGALGTAALGMAALGAAAGVAMAGIAAAAINMGEAAERARSQFDLSGEGVARLSAVASKSGLELDDLAKALKSVSDNAAKDDDDLKAAAQAVGLSADQLRGKNLPDLLRTLQTAYSQTADSANKYAAFQKILGDSFEQLYPTMQQGVGFLDGLYAAADRSGAAISGTLSAALSGTIGTAREAGAAWTELKQSVEGAVLALYEHFKPAIDGAIQGFSDLIRNIASAVQSFTNASREGGATALAIDAISAAAKALVTVLAGVTGAFEIMLATASGVLTQIVNLINGATDAAKELWKAVTFQGGHPVDSLGATGEKMKKDAQDTANAVKKIFEQMAAESKTIWGKGATTAAQPSNLRIATGSDKPDSSDRAAAARADQIKTYIDSLKQAEELAKAEADNWGKSNVERAQAVALAKAQAIAGKEGRTLTDEQLQSVLSLAGATQRYKDRVAELRQKQQELNAVAREFSESIASGLDQIVVRGKNAKDVLSDLLKTFASSSLRGALTGEGIFGKMFGLGGKDGAPGGLLGAFFNDAAPAATSPASATKVDQQQSAEAKAFGAIETRLFSGLESFVGKLTGVLDALVSKLGSLFSDLVKAISNIFSSLSSSIGTGGGGILDGLFSGGDNFSGQAAGAVGPFQQTDVFSSIGGLFSGFFADGGTIPAGQWGIAGEQGPEPILGPATVLPNSALGYGPRDGGFVQHITFNVTSPDAPSFARSESQISAMLVRAAARGQRNI